jgi:hypothetical protein
MRRNLDFKLGGVGCITDDLPDALPGESGASLIEK